MSTVEQYDAIAAPQITPPGWLAYNNSAARVVLKPGAVDEMGGEVDALGCRRLLLVCGPRTRASRLFERVRTALGDRVAGIFEEVVEHSATTLVTRRAEQARALSIDGIVAVGGGSASDTAKGIAILLAEGGRIEDHASTFIPPDRFFPKELPSPKLPVIAVPTTGSAAEVTPGLGIRDEAGKKLLFWDVKLSSRLIVLDPEANVEVPADCRNCRRSPTTSRSAAPSWPPPTSRAWSSPTPASASITPSATASARWAACPTERPTPSCCPSRWPTTCRSPRRRSP